MWTDLHGLLTCASVAWSALTLRFPTGVWLAGQISTTAGETT